MRGVCERPAAVHRVPRARGRLRALDGRPRAPAAALWDGFETDFYLRLDLAGRPVPRWARATGVASAERPHLAIVA